jgi:hypothetical protein
MVLDSAFDPAGDTPEEGALTQAVGFNETYNRFGEWCEDNEECAFTTTDFNADWLALEKELDKNSIVTKAGRFVNHKVLETATIQAFYSENYWPTLGKALQNARNGKGAGLLALADEYNGRDKKGRYTTSSDSKPIIDCASGIVNKGFKNPAKMLKTAKEKAPWFYRDAEKSWFEERDYCGKPFTDAKLISLDYSGYAPIVVIGGDKDAATPFRWAEKMSKNLKNSVLVKFTGEGHGSVGFNWCTTEITRLTLKYNMLPVEETECGKDVPFLKPDWWDRITKSVPGKRYSGLELGPQLGFELAGFFTEFFVIRSDIDSSRKAIFQALLSNDLVNVSPENDGVDDYVFFVHDMCEIHVGVHFISLADLAALESGDPNELLPEGSTMAVIYTYEDYAECH